MLDELKLSQLLCSRLCHDLVGPAGAVNAGLELLDEAAPGMEGENGAYALVGRSARQVTRRLAFFRMAFGMGASAGGNISLAEIRDLAGGLLADGNVALDWSVQGQYEQDRTLPAPRAKLILNLMHLAVDALPRGGLLTVKIAELPEGLAAAVSAVGQGAGMKDDLIEAMNPNVTDDHLTARNIHGYFTSRLAQNVGVDIEMTSAGDKELRLAVLFPN
ncbi:MAG: histidine phosphotransferase family protein [Rhodospirillales bacterium]|nr:histidine phosphotransferase family protein [Rhodospirillales bacterium]